LTQDTVTKRMWLAWLKEGDNRGVWVCNVFIAKN
jgi:hypothetical protein